MVSTYNNMSYELYCYKPTLTKPDLKDARRAIEIDEDSSDGLITDAEHERMQRVANALLEFNPRLETFELDFDKIAGVHNISVEEARLQFGNNIEINTPEDDDHYVQINIFDDNVSLSFAFDPPPEFLDKIISYTEVVSKETGYFLYDPQEDSVSNPLHPIKPSAYESRNQNDGDNVSSDENKPWWRFW